MTFFLARLRLAHLCREMTDSIPLSTPSLLQLPYTQILTLDAKLQEFLSTLPFFLKSDPSSRERSKDLETVYPKLPVLRYCITTEAHSKRCKLHQRFLHRQSLDPRYSYSRRACLDSARAALHAHRELQRSEMPAVSERMGMAVHFTHLALVVLVMDLCFNRDAADSAEIKEELRIALQMFKGARNASPLLIRFLGSLEEVLGKYGVRLDDEAGGSGSSSLPTNANVTPGSVTEMNLDSFNGTSSEEQMQLDIQDPGFTLNTPFDEFWMLAMQGEQTADSIAWDNLFSALDSRPL